VLEVNTPPQALSASPLPRRVQTDSGLSLPLASLFSDPDPGDRLTVVASLSRLQQQADGSWQLQGQPLDAPWLTVSSDPTSGAGQLHLSPGRSEAGRYRLHLLATDLHGASSSQSIDLDVIAVNAAPQVARQLGDPQRRQQPGDPQPGRAVQ
jgi:hypothetical protein